MMRRKSCPAQPERATKLKPALKITSELKEGDASLWIIETAENGEFNLIVIDHKGDSKIKELFLGSTSEQVAHQAKCAVLITNKSTLLTTVLITEREYLTLAK